MPYALQQYYEPDWERAFPESWARRLREVSPVHDRLAHLRPRYFSPHDSWYWPEQGQWALYSCTPRTMVHPEKVAQLAKHWSELATEGERVARHAVVSNYQHFMWHTQGVLVQPFLILQGDQGGTPAKYTQREKRYLDASGCVSEPVSLGFFPAAAFDERAVAQIAKRDRLLEACNRFDELEKMDRPESLRAEDEAAERVFRETYLDTMAVMLRPNIEYLQSAMGRKHMEEDLRPAPDGTADAVAQWREHWLQHGSVIGAPVASKRKLQIAVR